MAPSNAQNQDLLQDLGIKTDGLAPEQVKLVHIMLVGMKALIQKELNEERVRHEKEVYCLENQILALQAKNDDLENYSRRNAIVISGKKIDTVCRDENCYVIASKLITEHTGVSVSEADIDVTHRLGKPRPGMPDKRNLIVKFVRRETKSRILKACKIRKPSDIFFRESVSRTRNTILYVLRRVIKDYPTKFKSCSTEDGNVRLFLPKPGEESFLIKATVNTREQLDKILLVGIGCTSEKYEPKWETK